MSKTHACWCYSFIVRRAYPLSNTVQLFPDHDVMSGGLGISMTMDPYVFVVDVGVSTQSGIEMLVVKLEDRGIHAERLSTVPNVASRSEEHTSELQSQFHLVCRL